jgi:DNA-binding GntR family transcriptional regulator
MGQRDIGIEVEHFLSLMGGHAVCASDLVRSLGINENTARGTLIRLVGQGRARRSGRGQFVATPTTRRAAEAV